MKIHRSWDSGGIWPTLHGSWPATASKQHAAELAVWLAFGWSNTGHHAAQAMMPSWTVTALEDSEDSGGGLAYEITPREINRYECSAEEAKTVMTTIRSVGYNPYWGSEW